MTNQPGVSISILEEGDLTKFVEVINLFVEVFEIGHFSLPTSDHLQGLLAKKDFMVFAAMFENKVVGGLTANVLDSYYSEKPLVYIYDLAVDCKYQKQGIGRELLATINKYCAHHNFEEVFVQADKADGYALDFYRSTLPTKEEEVVHFSYTLNTNG